MFDINEVIELDVILDDPEIDLELDFKGEFVSGSDGQDYKRGYEEGHTQGLLDGHADGYDKGYNEGHKVGYSSGYHTGKLEGLAEGYDNGYKQGKTDGYKDGYDEGYEKGYSEGYEKGLADGTKEEQEKSVTITKNGTTKILPDENKVLSKVTVDVNVADSYYDTFWDGWTNFGERTDFPPYTFRSWTEEMFYPKYDLIPTSMQNAFAQSTMKIDLSRRLNDCGVILDTSKCLYCSGAFSSSLFTKIPFISFESAGSSHISNAFAQCKQLVILEGIKVLSTHMYNSVFSGCVALTTIKRIEGEIGNSISFAQSPLLDDLTVDNIVNAYADMTGQTAPVLTFHADVKARVVADDSKEDTDPTKHNWLKTLTSKNVTLA